MDILIDSREKARAIRRITAEFDRREVNYTISKLFVGDYVTFDNSRLVIDRKRNLTELYNNLCHDFTRFEKELKRAKRFNIKLVILCEHGDGIEKVEDVVRWQNPQLEKTPYAWSGEKLYREILKIKSRYNVDFLFCDKKATGQVILELLS